MKTLDQKIQICKNYGNIASKSYAYKMGGITEVVITKKGVPLHVLEFDEREYYTGRGAKYNNSIKHDYIKETVSLAEFNRRYKVANNHFKTIAKKIKENAKEEKINIQKQEEFKAKGLYGLNAYEHGTYVALSREEQYRKTFDAERLARTLDVSIHDVNLLRSSGKTYVFAKQLSTGKTLELYHSDLSCNDLNISVSEPSEERIKKFQVERERWSSAPFAHLVGMTTNENHFVC